MSTPIDSSPDAAGTVHAADKALARRAAAGDKEAVAEVFALLRVESERAARRFHLPSSSGDEIAQQLAERLLARDDSPLVRTFSGMGSLRMWLRTVALRNAASKKSTPQTQVTAPEALLERLAASGRVDLAIVKEEQAPHVQRALREALASLTAHERTVLRLQLLGGCSIDALASRYQVHRATTARWLQRIRQKLLEALESSLGRELKLAPEDVRSVIRHLRGEVELSLERMLDERATEEESSRY